MFLAECWRTLPGSQPPKPPPQCSVCRPDQSATLELPYLQTGVSMGYVRVQLYRPCAVARYNIGPTRQDVVTQPLVIAAQC